MFYCSILGLPNLLYTVDVLFGKTSPPLKALRPEYSLFEKYERLFTVRTKYQYRNDKTQIKTGNRRKEENESSSSRISSDWTSEHLLARMWHQS